MGDEPERGAESSDDGDADASDHGVGRKYLESLPPGSVVAYRGEPSAVEISLLRYSMNEARQLRFDSAISDLVQDLRAMSSQERNALLTRLSAAAVADDVAVHIETDDLPSSEEGPVATRQRRRLRGGWRRFAGWRGRRPRIRRVLALLRPPARRS